MAAAKKKKNGGAKRKGGSDPLVSFRMREEIKAIILLAVGAFLVFAMFADVAGAGVVGGGVAHACRGALGVMAYVLPFVLIIYAIAIFANKGYSLSIRTHIFVVVMFVMLMLLISAFWLASGPDPLRGARVGEVFADSAAGKGGGVAGMYAGSLIIGLIGKAGLFILSIAALAVSALLLARTTLAERFDRIAQIRADMRERREEREEEQRRYEEATAMADEQIAARGPGAPEPVLEGGDAEAAYGSGRSGVFPLFGGLRGRRRDGADNANNADHMVGAVDSADTHVVGMTGLQDDTITDMNPTEGASGLGQDAPPTDSFGYGIEPKPRSDKGMGLGDGYVGDGHSAAATPVATSAPVPFGVDARSGADGAGTGTGKGRGTGADAAGNTGVAPDWFDGAAAERNTAAPALGLESASKGFAKKKRTTAYKLPPIDLLKKSQRSTKSVSDKELQANARKLEETLRDFRVDAKVLNVTVGPTVTRYEVEPDVGVKIQSIRSLEPDLSLRLEVSSVRVVPMPGQAVVGIEAYNTKRSLVTLREIIDSPEFREKDSKISFVLGKNISGDRIIADLSDMPHLLIAGTTGSGKSVCINSILLSIMYKASPDEVKLILVDPKVVELKPYSDIPHLLLPVVTSPERAATALGYAVTIMNERYAKFAEFNVRNLNSYNELMLTEGRSDDVLPQIVIVIDELSDLMMIAPQKVQESISRLAAMARAAGMHLIVATQQPLASILTSVIKANIPSRIAFSVSSNSASRVILDESGAERLHGKGDMLFSPVGTREPMRVQGAFVSEAEVYKVTEYVKKEMDPDYSPDILDAVNGEITGDLTEDEDELFRDSVEAVVAAKQASVSMLQRRFRIGY
ncbi:MAG: DNA translocase FtsK, partial [Clostridiales Family XIII bacterium]|nr:DNA translocase FtsK [Clostridiales Family XIII bacterium]